MSSIMKMFSMRGTQGVAGVYNSFMDYASMRYKAALGAELNKMGLQYEDLLNSEHPHIKEAIELADPEVQLGRKRRLKRATDLSFKTKVLQDYAPDMVLEPFKFHLRDDINKIQQRNNEKDIMNLHKM